VTSKEPIAVTLLVVGALRDLNVRYLIAGSLASALHGVVRATLDADLLAELRIEHAVPLVRRLETEFYADLESVQSAIHRNASFNLIHLDSMFKVDVFVAGSRPFDHEQIERRRLQTLGSEPGHEAYFASPEDTILSKLEWFRKGGSLSCRQWSDVLGVLKVQGDRLDLGYLRRWARDLAIADLLERALSEAIPGRD